MGGNYRSALNDVVNAQFIGGTITVGVTEVAARVGGSNLADRQEVNIYNSSSATIYYGPTGVTTSTGIPIGPSESISLQYGENIDVYLIAGTAGNTVIIQEAS